ERLLEPLPRPACRAGAGRVCRLHARGGAVRALPLAGAPAQAARAHDPARARAGPCEARRGRRADDCLRAPRIDARHRRRHRQSPVELRGRAALDPGRARELARRLAGEQGEAVCLSTCNRTELYLADGSAEEAERKAEAALLALEQELGPLLYRLRDEAAALHLFRVAAGLDSMVPGEGEILGQVRSAHEAGAAGPILDRLFRHALHAGKKARTETAISESPASVSSAAAALAEQVFGDLRDRA